MSYKSFAFGLLGIALGAFTTGALQVVVAWKAPNQQAPQDNVDAPINVGATLQNKIGSFTTSNSIGAGYLIQAPWVCIGGDCRNAWPTSGVSQAYVDQQIAAVYANIAANVAALNASVAANGVKPGTFCGMRNWANGNAGEQWCQGHRVGISCPPGYVHSSIPISVNEGHSALSSCVKI